MPDKETNQKSEKSNDSNPSISINEDVRIENVRNWDIANTNTTSIVKKGQSENGFTSRHDSNETD